MSLKSCSLLIALSFLTVAAFAEAPAPSLFDIRDASGTASPAPKIAPWKVVPLDPEYGGLWIVAGDLDGDGMVEIVSAENFNREDTHFTSAAAAHRLDGTVMWQWGDPGIGRKEWFHDVALQIHDWDGDGRAEVILCAKDHVIELDGATGKERRRLPLPPDASDCLVFCDLQGKGRASDVLVKDRYHQIWAYDHDWNELWTVRDPGGYRTAHQPRPIDLDGDGKDEIMAGYALLNSDGTVRWVYRSSTVDLSKGHLDCCRVVRQGKTPKDFRLALTCCGADNLALLDGLGNVLWEIPGYHFESIKVGRIVPSPPGPQILVDIDHQPQGNSPLWVVDERGAWLGQIVTAYSRHHALIDWNGDGSDEIVVAYNRAIYNHQGERAATLAMPASPNNALQAEQSVLTGDMTGDGIPDLLIPTPEAVYIFQNDNGKRPEKPVVLGTGMNVTLY